MQLEKCETNQRVYVRVSDAEGEKQSIAFTIYESDALSVVTKIKEMVRERTPLIKIKHNPNKR